MISKLASLFGALSEPVIAALGDRIIYRNAVANHTIPFAGGGLSELVPEIARSAQPDNFLTETVLRDEKYTISGTVLDEITVYIFRPMNGGRYEQASDVIASVSMALREPMAVMNIAARQLLPFIERQKEAALSEYASMMHRSIFSIIRALNRLDALVFMTGGLADASERTLIDLKQLTADLIRSVSGILELEEGRLTVDAETAEARIYGDRRLLERMLLCLIGNALIFTPEGTRITISIKMSDGKALITVADDGGGISDDARFDVWSRYGAWRDLTDTRRGAGFGLSVVQAIARLHGGGALIETKTGSGTRVLVSLLASPEPGTVPVFDAQQCYRAAGDMREIFAELAPIIPKEKFSAKYMD